MVPRQEGRNKMATKFFYARDCRYGINVIWQNADGSTDALPGMILRFKNRAARDAFVEADVWDGNYHREALTRAQVEKKIRKSASYWGYGDARWDGDRPAEQGEMLI